MAAMQQLKSILTDDLSVRLLRRLWPWINHQVIMHYFNVEHSIFKGLPPDRKVVVLNLPSVELVTNIIVYVVFCGKIAQKTGLVRVELTPRKKVHGECWMVKYLIYPIRRLRFAVGLKIIHESIVVDSHILVDQILRAFAQPFIYFLMRLAPISIGGRILAVN